MFSLISKFFGVNWKDLKVTLLTMWDFVIFFSTPNNEEVDFASKLFGYRNRQTPTTSKRGNQITNSALPAAEVISIGHEAQLNGSHKTNSLKSCYT